MMTSTRKSAVILCACGLLWAALGCDEPRPVEQAASPAGALIHDMSPMRDSALAGAAPSSRDMMTNAALPVGGQVAALEDMELSTDQALGGALAPEDMGELNPPLGGGAPPEDMGLSADLAVELDMGGGGASFEERWPESWSVFAGNPVLSPSAGAQSQGLDNVYAPHVMWHEGQWWMWYGGQGADGKDAIFLAWSQDLALWSKHGGATPIPVVDHGASNHVNDPSVVWVEGTFYMYYTEAPVGEEDEVHLATSADGVTWQKQGVVLDVGAPGSWEPDRVGRPSVLYEGGEFRMWYDGQVYGVARHVGYATSPDGFTWTKHPGNPVLLNEGAIDVAKVGDRYVMLVEGHSGTRAYHSQDRLSWSLQGSVIELSGGSYDLYGQVTPHLVTRQGEVQALLYGGASDPCWCKNRVAAAFPLGEEPAVLGCGGCLQGAGSCEEACQAAGFSGGSCGAPGSTDPSQCCDCVNELGCEGCLQGFESCEAACQAAGFSGGVCGAPGSIDPGACCACQ